MSKTFEEELAGRLWDILYPNHDRTGADDVVQYENRINELMQVFKDVRRAEMDIVIDEVVGGWVEPSNDSDDEIDRVNNQNMLIS